MSYGRGNGLSKLSLDNLRSKEEWALGKIKKLSLDIKSDDYISSLGRSREELEKLIDQKNQEISRHRANLVPKSGFISSLFGIKELPESSVKRISILSSEIADLKSELDKIQSIHRRHDSAKKSTVEINQWLLKVRDRIRVLEDKKVKDQSLKNKAAENTLKKRKLGSAVKKFLLNNEFCPYCERVIKDGGHADHIYPLSKGGESTERNMVLVCVDCNSKKSDLTLRSFIAKYNLNRDDIEARLDFLGKDF